MIFLLIVILSVAVAVFRLADPFGVNKFAKGRSEVKPTIQTWDSWRDWFIDSPFLGSTTKAIWLTDVLKWSSVVESYYYWQMGYWQRRGIPGPPGLIFLGNMYALTDMNKPVALVLQEWTKIYGKVYGIQEGLRRTLVISDVDMVRELFTKKFESFHGRKIRPTVEGSVLALMGIFDKEADQKAFNICPFYKEFTLDVIYRVALGQNGSQMFTDNTKVAKIDTMFRRSFRQPLVFLATCVPILQPPMRKLFLATAPLRKSTVPFLFEKIFDAIDKRIETREKNEAANSEAQDPADFIDLFLDARAEQDYDNSSEFKRTGMHVTKQLTREEIAAQCFVFLVAGFDTTATSLSCVTYLLAKYPSVQENLQKEIDICCDSESISYETLAGMKYLDSVVKEGLRMYPLATIANARRCMRPTILGTVPVSEGDFVIADTLTLHFDPNIWGEDAHEFRPERWLELSDRPQAAFLAFGIGPRQCIGMRLAQMEEKLLLAHLLRRFDIVATGDTEEKLSLRGSVTFSPESVTVGLRRRRTSHTAMTRL